MYLLINKLNILKSLFKTLKNYLNTLKSLFNSFKIFGFF